MNTTKRPQFSLRGIMLAVTLVAFDAGIVAYQRPKHPAFVLAALVGWPLFIFLSHAAFAGRAKWLHASCIFLSGLLMVYVLYRLKQ